MSRLANLNMSRGAALSLARLISGVVRIKVVALALGVGGVGVFALVQQVNLTAVSLVGLGLAVPIINLGRPSIAAGRFAEAGEIAGTAIAILAFNIVLLLMLSLLLGSEVIVRVWRGQFDPGLLWSLVGAIVLGAAASTFWEGMSYLSDRFDVYTRAAIASAFADMLFVATGAWAYGLRGAIIALPAGPLVLLTCYAVLLRRDKVARQVLRNLSFSASQLPRLLTYSAMMFGSGAVTSLALTVARAQVLTAAGATANGYLQSVTSVSGYILSFLTTGFYGHLHAHAAAEGDTPQVRLELDKALRLGILMSFTGCGATAALANYLIPMFFSREFVPAEQLMVTYMPGEFCYQVLILLTAYQLTVSRRRRFLAWGLGYIGLLSIVAAAAIPRMGAAGFVAAHVVASAIMLGIAAHICWRSGQISSAIIKLLVGLMTVFAVTSAALIYLNNRRAAEETALLALIPFAVTGLIIAKELFDVLTSNSQGAETKS